MGSFFRWLFLPVLLCVAWLAAGCPANDSKSATPTTSQTIAGSSSQASAAETTPTETDTHEASPGAEALQQARDALAEIRKAAEHDECQPLSAASFHSVFELLKKALEQDPALREPLLTDEEWQPLRARIAFHTLLGRSLSGQDLRAILPDVTFYGSDWGSAPGSHINFTADGHASYWSYYTGTSSGTYTVEGNQIRVTFTDFVPAKPPQGIEGAKRREDFSATVSPDGELELKPSTNAPTYTDTQQGVCDA